MSAVLLTDAVPAHAGASPRAMRWLRSLRWRVGSPPALAAETDRRTGLLTPNGLLAIGEAALRAAAPGWPCTMAVLEFADLSEVHEIWGAAIGRKLQSRIVGKLRALARQDGIAARTDVAQFTVVWPGVPQERVMRAVRRAMGDPAVVELDAGDCELVLVPDLRVHEEGCGGMHLAATLARLEEEIRREREQERERNLLMQRERERLLAR